MSLSLTPVRLGMVRLTDAAPVVLAQARGLFTAERLAVEITVEPSWANVADKLAWGLLDGAVMLPPLAIAMVLGLRSPATALIVPAGISLNGNAITLARRFADPVLEGGRPNALVAAERLGRSMGRGMVPGRERLRIAVVHAFSTHDLLLRLFLERGGVDPGQVEITVVPPAEMVAALAAGQVDGFCAGAPWGGVAAEAGVGRTVAVTSEIWADHPEKCLAMRGDWAEANQAAMAALVRALLRAGQIADDPAVAADAAALLSGPEWVGVDAPLIAASLPGGRGSFAGEVDRSVFAARDASVPFRAHAAWFVRQMARRRELPMDAAEQAMAAYRPEIQAAAAVAVGLRSPPAAPLSAGP